jgi:Cd2+/Zn2+-exporting ATPase
MLTGDNKEYAVAVRKELNIKKSVSELLPQDKLNEVENLINNKDNKGVCFIGDGINDAPCLTRANVGISMGGLGSDIAIESSDIVITDDDMKKVPFIIKLAKRTNSIAKQNIALALGIKGIVIFLSLTGIYTSLWLAIASDVGVLLITILNAIRNKFKVI